LYKEESLRRRGKQPDGEVSEDAEASGCSYNREDDTPDPAWDVCEFAEATTDAAENGII